MCLTNFFMDSRQPSRSGELPSGGGGRGGGEEEGGGVTIE